MPRSLADLVAQHLVASGRFLDDDPELAYLHAKTARRLAARLGGVREAVAITAYLAEHYDEALTEFRAVRRMTGNHEVLPTMADCERALGRPEKALALSREKQVKDLEEGSQIEMLIVAAGARRDMGQTAAAIQTLEIPELTKRTRADWLPRLRYAYADALAEAGRTEEALVWFHRAAGADADGSTGAAERAAELEGLTFTDLDDAEEENVPVVHGENLLDEKPADEAVFTEESDDEDDFDIVDAEVEVETPADADDEGGSSAESDDQDDLEIVDDALDGEVDADAESVDDALDDEVDADVETQSEAGREDDALDGDVETQVEGEVEGEVDIVDDALDGEVDADVEKSVDAGDEEQPKG
ncbi:hypothetical protein GCM10009789_58820 [Kribbella sancticallisti]|uniref:Tetratricopeptide repeat protein n=1 Tax=Kribbella sancticallisti TaxID=460087 RepID=A0ABP4Q065_9ACTN